LTLSLNIIIFILLALIILPSGMAKTLCDWSKKDILKRSDQLALIVGAPEYVCRKCARVAIAKKYLCAGVRLERSMILPFPDLPDLETGPAKQRRRL
jgi:hypothetical protein